MKKVFGHFLARLLNNGRLNVYPAVLLVALAAFLFSLGYVSTIPLTATYDPAMHAEIVDPIISTQIYPLTWSPLADTQYTYPPLFHWLAFLLSRSGIEPIYAVVILGLILYAAFPLCLYLLGSLWGRKIALLSAVCGTAVSGWTFVFLAGEYPQLLAMDLSVVFLYFYLRSDYVKSGLLLGLAFLSHPFVPVYLTIFVIVHSFFELGRKNRSFFAASMKCLAIALLIALVWLPQYLMIVQNAMTGRWGNARWYYRPGFVGPEEIGSLFFNFAPAGRVNPVIFVFSLAGAGLIAKGGFKKGRDGGRTALLILFLFTAAFSVFHIPGTQYKFPDMLAITIPPLSAFGMSYSTGSGGRLKWKGKPIVVVLIALVLLFSAWNAGLADLNSYSNKQKFVSTDEARNAAEWLRNYDPAYSRIVKTGDDEVWFSVISHKYAMDPMITDLEALTESTKRQMDDRATMIERMNNSEPVSDIAGKYGIKYVITEGIGTGINEGKLVYEKKDVRIYEFSGSPG